MPHASISTPSGTPTGLKISTSLLTSARSVLAEGNWASSHHQKVSLNSLHAECIWLVVIWGYVAWIFVTIALGVDHSACSQMIWSASGGIWTSLYITWLMWCWRRMKMSCPPFLFLLYLTNNALWQGYRFIPILSRCFALGFSDGLGAFFQASSWLHQNRVVWPPFRARLSWTLPNW